MLFRFALEELDTCLA